MQHRLGLARGSATRAARAGLVLALAFGVPAAFGETSAWFGDLHLHTGLSFDAAASGTRTTPDDAYRYAKGEAVSYLGHEVRRKQPLDFLAVTDHAEYLAIAWQAADSAGDFGATDWPERIAANHENTLGFMRIFSPSAFQGSAHRVSPCLPRPGLRRSQRPVTRSMTL